MKWHYFQALYVFFQFRNLKLFNTHLISLCLKILACKIKVFLLFTIFDFKTFKRLLKASTPDIMKKINLNKKKKRYATIPLKVRIDLINLVRQNLPWQQVSFIYPQPFYSVIRIPKKSLNDRLSYCFLVVPKI